MDYGLVFEFGFWAAAGLMTGALATLALVTIVVVVGVTVQETLPKLSPTRLVARWRE